MIHIATAHHKTKRWVDIQLRYLNKYIAEPYRVYAGIDGIDGDFSSRFYYLTEKMAPHAEKLNFLAQRISSRGNDDDILIFLDGDSFPISSNFIPLIKEKLSAHKLIAVRRDENPGDIHPHPCLCVTTIGFWKWIEGDWSAEYTGREFWGNRIMETGGNLLKKLSDRNINWFPLLRTNKKNLHPLWFGIYGGIVYHHGAGFRLPLSRRDVDDNMLNKILYFIRKKMRIYIPERVISLLLYRQIRLIEHVYNKICEDEEFFLEFMERTRKE